MRFAAWLIAPALLTAVSIGLGLGLTLALGLTGTSLLRDYTDVAALTFVIALLAWTTIPWFRAPHQRALGPISTAIATLRERWLLTILPLALLPTFMTGFTISKIAVPLVTGYHFDTLWADADAMLFFGTDPWRITHAFIGARGSGLLQTVYTVAWGMIFALVTTFYTLSGDPRRVTRAFAALFATWLVGGIVGTALFSSVGPVFADLIDPSLEARFAPLHTALGQVLAHDGAILFSQDYLRDRVGLGELFRAGGVSAMPSMHLAVCSWLVLVAGRTGWRWPALGLWLTIWVASVHFGYHYALDGIVGSAIAWACWKVAMKSAPAPANLPLTLAAQDRPSLNTAN